MMNIEQARFNMIEQQIRPWEVLDQGVLSLLSIVKREDFVPPAYRSMAFVDTQVPLPHGQSMLEPKVEARLLQELAVQRHERVLEIGAGSGYMAALLAHKSQHVTTVEIDPELARMASENLKRAWVLNARVIEADAAAGLVVDGPFDVIVLSGSVAEVPRALLVAAQAGRTPGRDRRPAAGHARRPDDARRRRRPFDGRAVRHRRAAPDRLRRAEPIQLLSAPSVEHARAHRARRGRARRSAGRAGDTPGPARRARAVGGRRRRDRPAGRDDAVDADARDSGTPGRARRGAAVLCICHHGARSAQVVAFLERAGFTSAYNLAGGIDAWSRDVDPGVARY